MDPDSRIARAVQKVSGTLGFSRIAPHILPPLDRLLYKISRGRFMIGQAMIPSIVLTTTGAKSGLARETPLACFKEGDAFLVVGSNFGRESHPAWTHNLLAHPEATVSYRGDDIKVRARLLEGDERAEAWQRVTRSFRNYNRYAERVTREIRLFLLEPI